MLELAKTLIAERNLELVDTLELPGRPERLVGLPKSIVEGPLASRLVAMGLSDGLGWSHQSAALEILERGRNVVVATGTASGKSLVFQLRALDVVLRDPGAKVLVFYPLKALASDQFDRWRRVARQAGLEEHAVARIDGDIPTGERQQAMERASIVLMTPDVCQAWLMRGVGTGPIRRFLDSLALLVMDEAHVYESVFGSNFAMLARRMVAAKARASQTGRPLQVIAATATIAYPEAHLEELTGLRFEVIGEDQNGAPAHERHIHHIHGPDYGATAEAALSDLLAGVLAIPNDRRGRFIAFHDSRQGIERVVREIDESGVLPYRSGYEAEDRATIERALRTGALDGVISTSALELGIDVADMTIGVNLGVPTSRKAFRQRIGRVGRASPGVFFLMADRHAFTRFGETFEDYYRASVEPSYLYLGNRFVQYAHARCLVDEMEVLGGERMRLPGGTKWPEGFEGVLRYAVPGGGRPREFDFIAALGADNPHFNYPLRQIGEESFEIKDRPDGRIGSIAMQQAIREAYPGATYLHFGRSYKVRDWQTRGHDRSIRVYAADRGGAPTKPILRKTINLSLTGDGIVDGHVMRTANGLVAEVHLQVTESVEGYTVGGNRFLYKDLRTQDPNMSRKQRDFRTTGIIVRIDEDWFTGGGSEASLARAAVADGLKSLISRERSIAPQDIDATHTNIAIFSERGPQRVTNAVIVYDAVYGGLRLTEDLFEDFRSYVDKLCRAASLAGEDALVVPPLADRLSVWAENLKDVGAEPDPITDVPDGWVQVYKPGSMVTITMHGAQIEREIGAPQMMPFGDQSILVYSYVNGQVPGMVPHAQIQTAGQEWEWALWNPSTGEMVDIDGDQESAA